jgi:hypothetical protein
MKKIKSISFTIFLCVLFNNIFSQNIPTDGLVAFYPFSGNTLDSSGNNNHATKNAGVSLTSDKNGNNNKAYYFDGTSLAWIDAANYPTLNTANMNNFAISVWFNPSSGNSANTNRNIVQMQDGQNVNYTITYNATTSKIDFYNWNGTISESNISFSSSMTIVPNTWNHLVLRIDSTNKTELFINNTIAGSSNQTVLKPILPTLVIGRHPFVSGSWNFLGKIDEVRVYNKYLSNENIKTLSTNCDMSNASINYNGPTTFCAGKNLMLQANLQGNTYTYTWKINGDVIPDASSSNYLATKQGTYTVKIDSSSCSSFSSPVSVIVNPLPNISITPIPAFINIKSNPIVLVGSPIGGVFSGPGISLNMFEPYLAGLGAKKINYAYSDLKGCINSTMISTIIYDTLNCSIVDTIHRNDTLKISVTDTLIINAKLTSVTNPNLINTIKVYPNPTKSNITIDFGNFGLMFSYQLKITNSIGQIVYSTSVNQQQTTLELNTWTGKGIYYIEIFDPLGQKIDSRKIILQ